MMMVRWVTLAIILSIGLGAAVSARPVGGLNEAGDCYTCVEDKAGHMHCLLIDCKNVPAPKENADISAICQPSGRPIPPRKSCYKTPGAVPSRIHPALTTSDCKLHSGTVVPVSDGRCGASAAYCKYSDGIAQCIDNR
jgi:hypothetical protein